MTYPNIEGLTYKDFPSLTCPAGDSWDDHESGTGTGECFDRPHTCQMAATILDFEERSNSTNEAADALGRERARKVVAELLDDGVEKVDAESAIFYPLASVEVTTFTPLAGKVIVKEVTVKDMLKENGVADDALDTWETAYLDELVTELNRRGVSIQHLNERTEPMSETLVNENWASGASEDEGGEERTVWILDEEEDDNDE